MQTIFQKTKLTVTQKTIVLSVGNKLVKANQLNDSLLYPEIYCNDEIAFLSLEL